MWCTSEAQPLCCLCQRTSGSEKPIHPLVRSREEVHIAEIVPIIKGPLIPNDIHEAASTAESEQNLHEDAHAGGQRHATPAPETLQSEDTEISNQSKLITFSPEDTETLMSLLQDQDAKGERPRVVERQTQCAPVASVVVADCGGALPSGLPKKGPVTVTDPACYAEIEGYQMHEHPLIVAWYHGRLVEAHRELKRMEAKGLHDDLAVFDYRVLEQIRRVASKFEESLAMLSADVSSLPVHEKNDKMKLEWGLQLTNGVLRATYSVERSLDVVRSLVAFQEKDLDVGVKEGVVRVDQLGDAFANDAMWRVISHAKSLGTKGDDVIIESSLDALDEPLGSIWLSGYSPPKSKEISVAGSKSLGSGTHSENVGKADTHKSEVGSAPTKADKKIGKKKTFLKKTKTFLKRAVSHASSLEPVQVFNGVPIPKPEKGHNRSSSLFFATKVTPLHATGSERLHGFRQTSVVEAKLNPVVYGLVSVFPSWVLRKMARGQLEKNICDFETKVKTLQALDQRLTRAPRARFYESLRRHLAGEPQAPISLEDVSEYVAIWRHKDKGEKSQVPGTQQRAVVFADVGTMSLSSDGLQTRRD